MIGRISQKGVFERLAREGRTARAKGLWVSAMTDSSVGEAHVAYAIGRKSGGAVQRNRLRRQLRHIVRSCEHALRPGWYLVGVSAGVSGLSFGQMEATLTRLLAEVQQ